MKILCKKLTAIFMSVLMAACVMPKINVFAQDFTPYVENGKYYRISNGEYIPFNINYDEMVSYFQNEMIQRKSSIIYYFATTDKKYSYVYENSEDYSVASKSAMKLFEDLYRDLFIYNNINNENSPALGDYLFHSIENYSLGTSLYLSQYDTPTADGEKYYTFKIELNNIGYITDCDQETLIRQVAEDFSANYIKAGSTDYEKVKTIYDFVVRISTYDYDVFQDKSHEKYPSDSQRYKFSHSAFGAIFGGLNNTSEFDISSFDSVSGEKIISKADQGRAVCEGYSQLFYYLCIMNGIECRIVDGDNTEKSGKERDPHEWNYVYLDDDDEDDIKEWYQVDTTFASQNSLKQINYCNYDYFLCGSSNEMFNEYNHQQPYHVDGDIEQLYDWYNDENISSVNDYHIIEANISNSSELSESGLIAKRVSVDSDNNEKISYYYIDKDGQVHDIVINSNNQTIMPESFEGFEYDGKNDTFDFYIPYMVSSREYITNPVVAKEKGEYAVTASGGNLTSFTWNFSIISRDMNNDRDIIFKVGNNESRVDSNDFVIKTNYVGEDYLPNITVEITDGAGNKLIQDKDFNLIVYTDSYYKNKINELKDIGTYYIDIAYKGNYSGHFYLMFVIDKINLSMLNVDDLKFQYIPDYYLKAIKLNSMEDYIKESAASLTVGDINIYSGSDYSSDIVGGTNFGDSGYLILKGLEKSTKCVAGYSAKVNYKITEKFDITDKEHNHTLNGKPASSKAYVYTGSAIKPSSYDNLEKILTKGKDYKITAISGNVNAGNACVTVQGINGCTGTAKMYFVIQRKSIAASDVKFSYKSLNSKGGTYTLIYNGKKLVKDKDYTQSISISKGKCTLKLTGKGNYSGSRSVVFNIVTPSSKGNYAKLSSTSYTYDAKAKKPTVKVYNKSKKLIDSYYYTVSYSSNVNPGKSKVTIKFRNGYKGTLTYYFSIKPKKISISSLSPSSKSFTVKWKKDSKVTGYQIQYSTSSKFTKPVTKTIGKNTTVSFKVKNLLKKKRYYVRIRSYKMVGKTKYYSAWSSSKSVVTK